MSETQLAPKQPQQISVDVKVSKLKEQLMKNADGLRRALSGIMTPERAILLACGSIRKTPKLLECSPRSVFGAIAEAASYGWACDGILGDAYLVPFENRRKGIVECTLIPGYKGLRKLVEATGQVTLTMEAVHQGDEFEYKGRFELPKHVYGTVATRRYSEPVTGAYVIGMFMSTGIVKVFYMSADECKAHRDRYSQGWKTAVRYNKTEDSPWNSDNVHEFAIQCCKTVLRDAIARGEFPMVVGGATNLVKREDSLGEDIVDGEIVELSDQPLLGGAVESEQAAEPEQQSRQVEQPSKPASDFDLAKVEVDLSTCSTIKDAVACGEKWHPLAPSADVQAHIFVLVERRCEAIRGSRGTRSNAKGELFDAKETAQTACET